MFKCYRVIRNEKLNVKKKYKAVAMKQRVAVVGQLCHKVDYANLIKNE